MAAVIRYVDASLTTGSNNGTSWENAYQGADGLNTALNAVSANFTQVYVKPGVYSKIVVARNYNPVVVESVDGAETTIVDGGTVWDGGVVNTTPATEGSRCLTITNGTSWTFNGFTFRNGFTKSGDGQTDPGRCGGVYCNSIGRCILRNCVVRDCSSESTRAALDRVNTYDTEVFNCNGVVATVAEGTHYDLKVHDCSTTTHSAALYNCTTYRAEIYRCYPHTTSSNGAVISSGTHYYVHVHDCIAYGNAEETSYSSLINNGTVVNGNIHDCTASHLFETGTAMYTIVHGCVGLGTYGGLAMQPVFISSAFYDNSFTSTGLYGIIHQPRSIVGCTLAGNILGASDSNVVYIAAVSAGTVTEFFKNNILYGNTAYSDVEVADRTYGMQEFSMDNCWIESMSSRSYNVRSLRPGIIERSTNLHIGESPKFLDPSSGLYCLAPDSPCIGVLPHYKMDPNDCRYLRRHAPWMCVGGYEFGATIYCDPSDRDEWAVRGNDLGFNWDNAFYGSNCLDKALKVALPYDTIVLPKGEYTITAGSVPCVIKGIEGRPGDVVVHCPSGLSAAWSNASYAPGFESVTLDGQGSLSGLSIRRCIVDSASMSGCRTESSFVVPKSTVSGSFVNCTFRVHSSFSDEALFQPSGVSATNCLFLAGSGYSGSGVDLDDASSDATVSIDHCLMDDGVFVSNGFDLGPVDDTLAGFSDPHLTKLSSDERTRGLSSALPDLDLFGENFSGGTVGCCTFVSSEDTTWYCDSGLSTGRNDGSSWENAFRGSSALQSAVSASSSGDMIVLEDGTYYTTSAGSGVTVRSRNGYSNCVITRSPSGPQQGSGISFQGVTFRTTTGTGVAFTDGGDFTGCVFDGCGGSNGLLRFFSATNCLFLGSNGNAAGAYALFQDAHLDGCTISGCTWSASAGIIRNDRGSAHMFDCVVDSVPTGAVLCTNMAASSSKFGNNVINGIDSPGGLNADPLLDSSHKPSASSPALGCGDASRMTTTDLDGVQRKSNPSAGCFELDDTVYVDIDAAGAGTGKNWTDAFTTIQAGVDAVTDGGVVLVEDGRYYECVEIPTKRVDIVSVHGKDGCIIDASRTCNTDAIAQLHDSANYRLYNRFDGYRCGRCLTSKAVQGSKHYYAKGLTLTGGHTRAVVRTLYNAQQSAFGISSGAAAWGYFFLQDCLVEGCNSQQSMLCGTSTGPSSIDRCIVRNCICQNEYEGTSGMGGDENGQATAYVSGITNCLFHGIMSHGRFNGGTPKAIARAYHVSNCTIVPSLGTYYRAANTSARKIACYIRGVAVKLGPAKGKGTGVFNCVIVRDEPIQYGTETTKRTLANSVISTTCAIEANTTQVNVVRQDDVLDANFRPRRNSPAIGLSDSAYVYGDTDLAGNPRKEHPAAGCYEAPDAFDPADTGSGGLYVSSDLQTGLGTGTSWENAAKGPDSLQIASDLSETPGNVINVDDGTYSSLYRFDDRDTTFVSRNGSANCVIDPGNYIIGPGDAMRNAYYIEYGNVYRCACARLGYTENSLVKIRGFTFRNGVNSGYPTGFTAINAVVYNRGGGVVFGTVEDCVFDRCCAINRNGDGLGGGASNCNVSRCEFNGCWSNMDGGGVCNCTVDASTFDGCISRGRDGAAAYLGSEYRTMTGCVIKNCRTQRKGAVRSTTSTTNQFVNCTFINNRSGVRSFMTSASGAACGYFGNYVGCKFIRNVNWDTAEGDSSIVSLDTGGLVLDCLFEYNTCHYGCVRSGTVRNSVFRYNNAGFAVLYGNASQSGTTAYFSNCLLYDNNCGSVAGRQRMFNCTLYRNKCSSYVTHGNGSKWISTCNCFIVDNLPRASTSAATTIQLGSSGYFCNNVVRGSVFTASGTTSGNVTLADDADIKIVDILKPDLHLIRNSPAVEAGSVDYLQTTTDIDGTTWASVPSAGCYELRAYAPSGLPTIIAPFGSFESVIKVGARRYCTLGLTHMWDGIENVGYGVHDSSATSWKNLVQWSSWDATLSEVGSFDSNSLVCAGGERSDGKSKAAAWTYGSDANLSTSNLRTIEVCYRLDSAWGKAGTSGTTGPQLVFSAKLGSAANSAKRTIGYTAQSTTNYQKVSVRLNSTAPGTTIDVSSYFQKIITLTAVYAGDGVSKIYLNGVEQTTKESTPYGRDGEASYVTFGGRKDYFGMSGHIYSVRLYNTVLTGDQIAENALIDRQRFEA